MGFFFSFFRTCMRILIVEDEEKIAQFLASSLKAELYATDIASDGEKAVFMANTTDYDVIVLDYKLPKMTGAEVCTAIRATGSKVPILMLSVEAESSLKAELLDAGADDYMTKPFAVQELTARIRALLRRPQEMVDTILCVDTLTCDPQRYRVTRGDDNVRLTPKEFSLLEFLMRNVGIVQSRAMILEHVWDRNADPFSNTIESHILSLRKKIDTAHHKKLIHTVPGRGYVLDPEISSA